MSIKGTFDINKIHSKIDFSCWISLPMMDQNWTKLLRVFIIFTNSPSSGHETSDVRVHSVAPILQWNRCLLLRIGASRSSMFLFLISSNCGCRFNNNILRFKKYAELLRVRVIEYSHFHLNGWFGSRSYYYALDHANTKTRSRFNGCVSKHLLLILIHLRAFE